MEVILTKDVENLGFEFEVVSVKPGYGRNFLIPQGLAKLATPQNVEELNTIERKIKMSIKKNESDKSTSEKSNKPKRKFDKNDRDFRDSKPNKFSKSSKFKKEEKPTRYSKRGKANRNK